MSFEIQWFWHLCFQGQKKQSMLKFWQNLFFCLTFSAAADSLSVCSEGAGTKSCRNWSGKWVQGCQGTLMFQLCNMKCTGYFQTPITDKLLPLLSYFWSLHIDSEKLHLIGNFILMVSCMRVSYWTFLWSQRGTKLVMVLLYNLNTLEIIFQFSVTAYIPV